MERRGGFWVAYAGLGLIAAGVIAALVGLSAFQQPVRVDRQTVKQPALNSSSSVADARSRYGKPAQTIPGEQIGLPAGSACDAYELKDGLALICYQGGAS